MAYYKENFDNRNSTFQNIPPPPPPLSFYMPLAVTDEQFVKQFEKLNTKVSKKAVSITEIREKIRALVLTVNKLKEKQKILAENLKTLSEEEWSSSVRQMNESQLKVDEILSLLDDFCLEDMRKALAKRSAKRLRLKRLNTERKKEKEEMIKEREERSRKIDENLQKIQDDIKKVKLDQEAKLAADCILRDTLRKKHDAKKCIVKLEALVRLRKARQNTAKGRGEHCSENDEAEFNNNIEKLIFLWKGKLSNYELEERLLRDQLKESLPVVGKIESVVETLKTWRHVMFDGEPQFDFEGNVGGFLAVRAQWDQNISTDGSSLPVGWVVPEPTDKT
ncbi:meiosis-specific nuclear structural protein 1-like [Cydia amplana]|uniref:meiosis-specific nuclear structural protein 1-like n=1 Tax=Cydia amplana TaxID=1869771 RepID=UPI002FE5A927